MQDETEKHVECSRGWFFPRCLLRLYQTEKINAEEMMLLGKINALCNPSCYASNAWLGKWWRKDPRWVRKTIRKFKDLGLVRIKQIAGREGRTIRKIRVTYFGDDLSEKEGMGDPGRKVPPPREEKFLPPGKKSSSYYYSYSKSREKTNLHRAKRTRDAGEGLLPKTKLNGQGPAAYLLQRFEEFRIAHRLHVGTKRTNSRTAAICVEQLLAELEGNLPRVEETLNWYILHWKDPYVSTCHSLTTFCKKFYNLEKARLRSIGATSAPTSTVVKIRTK